MVEDDPNEARLILCELEESQYMPTWDRVEDADSMGAALANGTWDVVLSKWTLPSFDAWRAIRMVQERGLDIPVLVVSGIQEQVTAVEAMRAGAADYIVTRDLGRLSLAIDRAVGCRVEREARRKAETASAAKSEFLASMSHELRTPLNAMLGFAQLLQRDRRDPLSDRHRERVEQILKGGEHLMRLIDDILHLTRIEAGGISLRTERVSANEVLEEVIRTLEPLAAPLGVRLEAPMPRAQVTVIADRTRLAQVLLNFGSNAIKYNRRGGSVTFQVSIPQVDHVRMTVTDTGIGIPEDKQDKLFQPFQRAGQETGLIEGTGIGLVITKRLVQLMGGELGFRSRSGEGSEFWVELLRGVR